NNCVVKGGLNIRDPMRDVLALLLLENLLLAFGAGGPAAGSCFCHIELSFLRPLSLRRCLLLVRDRALSRSFAGSRVGMSALSTHREAAPVTISPIRTDLDEPLDIDRSILSQVSFDATLAFNHLTDPVDLVFIQIHDLFHRLDFGSAQNLLRTR